MNLTWEQYDSAIYYAKISIEENIQSAENHPEYWEKIKAAQFYNPVNLKAAFKILLKAYTQRYEAKQKKEDLEQLSLATKAAFKINQGLKNAFIKEQSKLRIMQDQQFLAHYAIQAAEENGQTESLETAYQLVELNKSALLTDALQKLEARKLASLPDSLAVEEKKLQTALAELNLVAIKQADSSDFNSQRSLLHHKIEAFKSKIQQKYPKYYRLQYAHQNVDISAIQAALPAKTILLEYFWDVQQLYLFRLSKNGLNLYKLKADPSAVEQNIKSLRNSLTDYKGLVDQSKQNAQSYTKSAYTLYQQLLADYIGEAEHLMIITDGILGHIPFEALLSEKTSPQTAFGEMPYLLKQYKISYNYSAQLWQENINTASKDRRVISFLGVAANYDKNSITAERSSQFRNLREGLQNIPTAKTEVQQLSEMFSGIFWQGSSSNERAFKAMAGDFGIIHLAMHALLNKDEPILSALAFTENEDSTENNFLEAWEIAQMDLKAQLVVLSACETAYGKFQQAEGGMSLARSFMYAGIPSLVVSLWQVNDTSTTLIMKSFYQYLSLGMDKATALQQAKLDYIQTAKETNPTAAHPAFWAAFIQLGDSQAIDIKTSPDFDLWKYGIIAIFIVIIIILSIFVLKRIQKNNS